MEAWQGNGNFQELVTKDVFISKKLRASEIQTCFDPQAYLKNLPQVYRRVFGPSPKAKKGTAKRTRKKDGR